MWGEKSKMQDNVDGKKWVEERKRKLFVYIFVYICLKYLHYLRKGTKESYHRLPLSTGRKLGV